MIRPLTNIKEIDDIMDKVNNFKRFPTKSTYILQYLCILMRKNVHTYNIGLYFLSWKKVAGLVFFERLEPSLNRKVIAEKFLFFQ